ncbi:MAG: hypothetical protein ACYTJ0_17330 [Planctomycetota bacterium]|jgi:hypothetical protein
MNLSRTHRLLALVTAGTGALGATAYGGGGESQTAYQNFPEDPTNIYVHGGSQGAIIADDVGVIPGTEGMRIDEIQMFLVAAGPEPIHDSQLYLYEHDPDTDLPGQLLGTMDLPEIALYWPQAITFDVCALGVRVPASGRLWVGIFIPAVPYTGWFLPGTGPSVGTSPNPVARQAVGDHGFQSTGPMNLMLTVNVVPEPCPANVNGDNVVDVDDLIEVVLDWGCEGDCAADVNADGVVGVDDVVEVILDWGPCE